VHVNDALRFDLVIPGEQFLCLKAKSQTERQRWLVALGTCKSRGTKSDPTTTTTSRSACEQKMPQLSETMLSSSLRYLCAHLCSVSHSTAIDDELRVKVQELRTCEAVLMEHLHGVKSIVNDMATPDVKVFRIVATESRVCLVLCEETRRENLDVKHDVRRIHSDAGRMRPISDGQANTSVCVFVSD
jgi:hypothetical protein